MKPKYEVLLLSDKDQERLTKDVKDIIDLIQKKTSILSEQALILRVLLETFEESQNCIVPFKNRYTEPLFNYEKSFINGQK